MANTSTSTPELVIVDSPCDCDTPCFSASCSKPAKTPSRDLHLDFQAIPAAPSRRATLKRVREDNASELPRKKLFKEIKVHLGRDT